MNTPLVVICAWAGGQETFDRHMPLWESHGLPILVCCPEDAPVKTSHEVFLAGRASHHGKKARAWAMSYLEPISRRAKDGAILFEYDSFCLLGKDVEVGNGLHCTIAINQEPMRFMARRYPLFPWRINYSSLCRMHQAAISFPDILEEGYHDRLMGAWAAIASVPMIPHDPPGFSLNTIEPIHYPAVYEAAQKGCCWWHGVKDEFTLNFIKNAYRKAK